MDLFPTYLDADCDQMLQYQYSDSYSNVFVPTGAPPMGVADGSHCNFFASPLDTEAMFTNSDEQSYDGSDSASVQHGSTLDANDNYGVFRTVPDMDSLSVSRTDLELLEQVNSEPQRPHKRKMKAKVSLANLTEEERVVRRRKKNREAAQLSRHRKMMKLDTLEQQVADQKAINGSLLHEREILKREAQALRSEVEYLKMVLNKSLSVASVFGALDQDPEPAPHLPSSFLLSVH